MELYLKFRQAHFEEGLSGRQIARDFGISRDSVSKMLAYSEPPWYRRTAPIKRPKLDPYTDQIDQWLAEDKARPRKQRHTAKRIFERLRDECRFDGGYTIIKDYVRAQNRGSREMFVPLSHPRGMGRLTLGKLWLLLVVLNRRPTSLPLICRIVMPAMSARIQRPTPRPGLMGMSTPLPSLVQCRVLFYTIMTAALWPRPCRTAPAIARNGSARCCPIT